MEKRLSKTRSRIEVLIQKYRGKADVDQPNIKKEEECGGGSMGDKKFSRREWLFTIAILLMAECWLLSASYEFAGWQEVVNFISFAAAIASILLAVIAIIYGFIQSDSSAKTAGVLREQADNLRLHTQNLSDSSVSITKQLDVISSITKKLDALDESIHASAAKLTGVEKTVEGMHASNKEFMNAIKEKRAGAEISVEPSGDSISLDDLVEVIFSSSTFEMDALGYAIYKYMLSKKKVSTFKFASAYHDVVDATDTSGIDVFFNIEAVLRSIGLFKTGETSDYLIINERFESVLRQCAEEAMDSDNKKLLTMIKKIDLFINKWTD